jgi:hypothetical protein
LTQLSPANVVVGVGEPCEGFVGVAVGDPFGNGEPVGDEDFVEDVDAVGDRVAVPNDAGVGNVPGK